MQQSDFPLITHKNRRQYRKNFSRYFSLNTADCCSIAKINSVTFIFVPNVFRACFTYYTTHTQTLSTFAQMIRHTPLYKIIRNRRRVSMLIAWKSFFAIKNNKI